MALFDYDRDGRNIVLTEGAEVLVHDGATEGPLWRQTLDARLVGVASTTPAIMAVDERGTLSAFEPATGALLGRIDTGKGARAMAAKMDGLCAIISRAGVAIADDEAVHRRLSVPDPSCVAWSSDGMLLVGSRDGSLTVFAGDDTPMQTEQLHEAITAAAWHPDGFWVIAAGIGVYRLDPAGVERITSAPADMPVGSLDCSPTGLIALRLGEKTALLLAYPSRETYATISYFDRTVTDVSFGPEPWIGVGMNLGDGNKLNLTNGAIHRTDTHPGREHHSWGLGFSAGPALEAKTATDKADAVAKADANQVVEYSRSDAIVGVLALVVIAAIIYYLVT